MDNEQLRTWRKRRKITQEKAGSYFGVKWLQYNKWENGHVEIPKYVVVIIYLMKKAKLWNLDVDSIS